MGGRGSRGPIRAVDPNTAPAGPPAVEPPTPEPVAKPDPAPAERAAAITADIRTMFADLSDRATGAHDREWVSIADLRERLGDRYTRTEVDTILMGLFRDPDVRMEPEPNRQLLRRRDHDAALRIGGEDRHLIAISRSSSDAPPEGRPARLAPETTPPAGRTPDSRSGSPARLAPAKVRADLAAMGDTTGATQYLSGLGLTAAELKTLARDLDIAIPGKAAKAEVTRQIVQWTVGQRLTSKAISRPAHDKKRK